MGKGWAVGQDLALKIWSAWVIWICVTNFSDAELSYPIRAAVAVSGVKEKKKLPLLLAEPIST